jgi:hypothetical protein
MYTSQSSVLRDIIPSSNAGVLSDKLGPSHCKNSCGICSVITGSFGLLKNVMKINKIAAAKSPPPKASL